jgi:hypothetical protein
MVLNLIIIERNTNILIYVKRRLGMCARKLGKLKEAAKIFRDVFNEIKIKKIIFIDRLDSMKIFLNNEIFF